MTAEFGSLRYHIEEHALRPPYSFPFFVCMEAMRGSSLMVVYVNFKIVLKDRIDFLIHSCSSITEMFLSIGFPTTNHE